MAKIRPPPKRPRPTRNPRIKITRSPNRSRLHLSTLNGFLKTSTTAQTNNLIHLISTFPRSTLPIDSRYYLPPWRTRRPKQRRRRCRIYHHFPPLPIPPREKPEGFRLGDLPPELCILIFNFADLEWTTREPQTAAMTVPRTMPPLIIALRAWRRHDLYFEALKLFYASAVYVFEFNSPWSIDKMSFNALDTIRKARYILDLLDRRRFPLLPAQQAAEEIAGGLLCSDEEM
ncbi:hypothetical protein GLAREA_05862 [Glarea lozoyensis ATCC 20868]|uniref:Uncharacterized protein n=1 Tax=Glarea lozoyensis (strain ATCC 20868 / MF5171) TaxID=1116229 RepID=S3D503_GLAL2|nr:uncharacterized protein GLAREA_05862 [Glarea lozoyensis ATCC 20868]EPE32850.1 hypothetical protein GLAREA_05862 [Glarea lozoyensis ATCC 20868]